jgi:transporter family protein
LYFTLGKWNSLILAQHYNFNKSFAMWWIYALLSAAFAALTAIFAKIGVAGINSNLATAIRTIIILIMAWGIVLVKGEAKGIGHISRHTLIFLVLSGLATGLSWIFYFKALQIGKVSQVAPVDKLSVALTIILSVVFLHEALTWKTAIGALLIMGGTLVLIL